MSIKVTCKCGKRLLAKDNLAGKTVKCPECGEHLRIPVPEPEKAAKQETPSDYSIAAPDEGYKVHQSPTANRCPSCGAGIAPGGVLCIECGYNTKLGRHLETKTEQPDARPSTGSADAATIGRSAYVEPPSKSERRGWIKTEAGLSVSFFSLIIGGIAFSIMAMFMILLMIAPETFGKLLGKFVLVVGPWILLAWIASSISLVTGWFVCCATPDETRANSMIFGTVGCVGLVLVLLFLMQVIPIIMRPSAPDFSRGQIQRRRSGMQEYRAKDVRSRKTIATIEKVLSWMTQLAFIGSLASFSLFLGAVGKHFRLDTLWKSACVLSILLGVLALWTTVSVFLIDTDSLGTIFGGSVLQTPIFHSSTVMRKLASIIPIALVLATYTWLIYLAHQARELVRAKV